MTPISFKGQVAIVTGAGRGLGRAYALELAKRGARVVINDIGKSEEGESWADKVVNEIVTASGEALASSLSVATPEGGQALVDAAVDRFGTVDILINNAGILRPAVFGELKLEDLHSVLGVHLLGAFYVTQPAWRIMCGKKYGRIIMTASSSSFGHAGNSPYSAAKSAMLGLTHSLALEGQAYDVKVNCLFPTAKSEIASKAPMVGPGLERLLAALGNLKGKHQPVSVAPMALYLASRECTVSGRTYSALAGRLARVVLGVNDGWFTKAVEDLTVEDVGLHWDQINDLSTIHVPTSLVDEMEAVGQLLQDANF